MNENLVAETPGEARPLTDAELDSVQGAGALFLLAGLGLGLAIGVAIGRALD